MKLSQSIRPKGTVTAEIAKRQENVDKNRYNNIHACKYITT